MRTGATGYFDLNGSKGMTLRVHYTEEYDIETAKRVITITKLQLLATIYPGVYYLDGTIAIDGTNIITMNSAQGAHSVNATIDTYCDITGDLGSISDVESNEDGNKSIVISVSVSGYTKTDSSGSGWVVSSEQSIDLSQIDRGIIYIDSGSGFELYQCYIDNGTSWDLYIPYIDNGTNWDLCG
jgi:hypothetical protein